MITRSFNGSHYEVSDWTEEVNVVPNRWGTIGNLGIFREEGVQTQSVTFEETLKDGAVIVDRPRGTRGVVGRDYQRKLHSFLVPHFPHDELILPEDIIGKRAYGSPDGMETLDLVRARKLERIRFNHAITLEVARAQAITLGTAYAPSGTISQDWYQEFTQTARPAAIDFLLGTATDLIAKVEECIAIIQDNSGAVSLGSGIVALCSPQFFSKFIANGSVKDAYKFYTATQEPLRGRLSAGGSATVAQRQFIFGGVTLIEMRDAFNGVPLIPVGEAFFLPTGTDYFKTYFAPANKFGILGTMGEQVYVFENANTNGTAINMETESNHISALLKPLLVVRANSSN